MSLNNSTSIASVSPQLRELSALSARVGQRIELVQGPGGNTSIKDGNSLWIKASGKWLADAEVRQIFVPLDLRRAKAQSDRGISDLTACVIGESELRPSIEAAVHALIDFPVIIHLHSINVLAWAVRLDGQDEVRAKLSGLHWSWLDYARPGPALASTFRCLLAKNETANIIILGNHGVLICAESILEAEALIETVEARLAVPARPWQRPSARNLEDLSTIPGCRLPTLMETHALARDPLTMQLASEGALYPDHVVFLGKSLPRVPYQGDHARHDVVETRLAMPPHCVIIEDQGVLLGDKCTAATEAMLACCALVALRQHDLALVRYLPAEEVEALSTWEMEKFRKQQNRNNV